jgi:hypothetical protein
MIGQLALLPYDLEVVRLSSSVWHRAEGFVDEWGLERSRCGVNLARYREVERVPVTEAEALGLVTCRRCASLHLDDLPQAIL